MKNIKFTLYFALILLTLKACTTEKYNKINHDINESLVDTKVNVFLTDSPAAYDAVFIDIQNVEIHSDSLGWTSLNPINTGIYNLLDFSNGMDTLLGSVSLPAGIISQIRLILGSNNGLLVDSVYHDLTVSSGSQSGLKLNIHDTLYYGMTYNIWVDFDAGRSILKTGNGKYKLKPVIRTFTDATSGSIKGLISPDSAAASVMAINGMDTIGTMADSTGRFMILGLTTGTYSVFFDNINNYKDTTISPISVTNGAITDMGTILMTK